MKKLVLSFLISILFLVVHGQLPYHLYQHTFPTAPNVIGFQRGKTKSNEFIVCGAHYDSFVRTEGAFDPDTLVSPGADDNASAVTLHSFC